MDLPKWNRARVKRKAPVGEEQDAFQGSVRRAGRGATRRVPIVLGGLGLGGLVIGAVVWGMAASRESAAERTRLLAGAVAFDARGQIGDPKTVFGDSDRPPPVPLAASEEEKGANIEKALQKLTEEASGSQADLASQLVRGTRAIRAGDHGAAAGAYRTFLEQAGEDHELAFLAREGLGVALEGSGDLEGALEVYQDLSGSKGSFYRDQALAHVGRVFEALERPDEALTAYRTFAEEYPLSSPALGREHVRSRLLELDPEAVPPAAAGSLDALAAPEPAPGADG